MLVCGGSTVSQTSDAYIIFKQGFNVWKKFVTMWRARSFHSCTYINGNLFALGGLYHSSPYQGSEIAISRHEQLPLEGFTKEVRKLPIALYGHTATVFNDHKMLICGGRDIKVRKTT